MSQSMGLLLRQWRDEKGWSREQLIDEIHIRYGMRFAQGEANRHLPSEKTIQRGESGATSPTVRTLTYWLGALQEVPENKLDTFISDLLNSVFSGSRLSEVCSAMAEQSEESVETPCCEEDDTSRWLNGWWRGLLSFVSEYYAVSPGLQELFEQEHPLRRAQFFREVALRRILEREQRPRQGTILIVDDEDHVLSALYSLLEPQYEVVIASNGPDALLRLEEGGLRRRLGLVISDQRMPGMSGVEFLQQARPCIPHAQLFILTAYADMDVVLASINELHVSRYFLKPFDHNEFLLAIEEAFEQYRLTLANLRLEEELSSLQAGFEEAVEARLQAHQGHARFMREHALAREHFWSQIMDDLRRPLRPWLSNEVIGQRERRRLESPHYELVKGLDDFLSGLLTWAEESPLDPGEEERAERSARNVSALVHEAYQILADEVEDRRQRMFFDLDMTLVCPLTRPMLLTLFATLMYRAIQWSPIGSHIHIQVREDEGFLCFVVRDAIPSPLPYQATQFFQLLSEPPQPTRPSKRSALDICLRAHLCQRCIQSYGGDLTFDFAPQHGYTTELRIPTNLSHDHLLSSPGESAAHL